MMRTTILVTAVLLSMLSASAIYAQRVEPDLYDGAPVINCEGMSPSMYTTVSKRTQATLITAEANKKVYKRFVVSDSDNGSSPSWSAAFDACTYMSDSGWRLPTQRELMLMWVLKRELEITENFSAFNGNYWSATVIIGDYINSAWYVSFGSGLTYTALVNHSYIKVRCIREIP